MSAKAIALTFMWTITPQEVPIDHCNIYSVQGDTYKEIHRIPSESGQWIMPEGKPQDGTVLKFAATCSNAGGESEYTHVEFDTTPERPGNNVININIMIITGG